MNNDTKAANIMTWQTYKKKFSPTEYYTKDGCFGTLSTIQPTMRNAGFNCMTVIDIDEEYNYKPTKPIEIVKDQLDIYKYSYVIYHVWVHRDKTGSGIYIFYR